jgi:signal transduction histidine kinase/CheY-like chemotaxis protein
MVLPVVIILVLVTALWLQLRSQAESAAWLDHTEKVIARTNQLQREVVDQETGLRGYLLSGDEIFLEPYRKVHPAESIETLKALVRDNPAQVERADEVRRRFAYWAESRPPLILKDRAAASTSAAMLEGKRQMDSVRNAVDAFERAELDLRAARVRANDEQLTVTRAAIVLLSLAAVAILAFGTRRQIAGLAAVYDEILVRERNVRDGLERERWIREGQRRIASVVLGDQPLAKLCAAVLADLAEYVHADLGVVYVGGADGFTRSALLGMSDQDTPSDLRVDEGFVGRAATSRALVRVDGVPSEAMRVRSGVVEGGASTIVAIPATADGAVQGVVELGFFKPVDEKTSELLSRIGESIGVPIRSEAHRRRLRELLEESQQQTEELQTQQEELRAANEELEQQGAVLREAHQSLEERQQEIEAMNARLEERAHDLSQSREAFRAKASEADRASRYKSEFLANMSHELRTPLNSTLILAKLLSDNKDGNLTDEQVRFARTIHGSGNDLLALINDVLDLSKVEAGHVEIAPADVPLAKIVDGIKRTFEPLSRQKGIELLIELLPGTPTDLFTDPQRLEQILRNLISNALKFTERGSVSFKVSGGSSGNVVFEVTDTGIGISPDQFNMIFQPFRQADGTTNRKYGGTGLGLSISRELAALLGGDIALESTPGKGSTFRLTLPRKLSAARPPPVMAAPTHSPDHAGRAANDARSSRPPSVARAAFEDDRGSLTPGVRCLLVIEDDVPFARIMYDLARSRNLQCVVTHDARSGVAAAKEILPHAIVLDVNLPDHTGLYVLDQLKRTPSTRHIPVHVVSVTEYGDQAMAMGAVGFLQKPASLDSLTAALETLVSRVDKAHKRLLIVEDDEVHRRSLAALLSARDLEITAVGTVKDALSALSQQSFDCVVTDVGLPDASGFELLEQLAADESHDYPPVIVYTGRTLSSAEERQLQKYASSIIVKGARSLERLVDEVTLFLHQVENDLPPPKQQMLRIARDREAMLAGKTILVVEDDVRNIFALTKVLEPKGATVVIARNGHEALAMLEKHAEVALVLMDIMMPEMDGLEAMRHIRKRREWAKLPIIALTAKAMPDDRDACLAAGASDYIPKPIDVEMLLSLIRVWTPR